MRSRALVHRVRLRGLRPALVGAVVVVRVEHAADRARQVRADRDGYVRASERIHSRADEWMDGAACPHAAQRLHRAWARADGPAWIPARLRRAAAAVSRAAHPSRAATRAFADTPETFAEDYNTIARRHSAG